jgi:hypothetical protein
MFTKARCVADVVNRSVVTVLCCLVVGFIFCQWRIFDPRDPAFQFVTFSVLGSMFFFTLRVNARNSLAVLLVFFMIHSGLVTHALQHSTLLRDFLFFAAVAGAVSLFFVVFDRPGELSRPIDPLVLATLFALTYFVATVILHAEEGFLSKVIVFNYVTDMILPLMTYGFLTGFGIGIGIFITDRQYLERVRDRIFTTFRELPEEPRLAPIGQKWCVSRK